MDTGEPLAVGEESETHTAIENVSTPAAIDAHLISDSCLLISSLLLPKHRTTGYRNTGHLP